MFIRPFVLMMFLSCSAMAQSRWVTHLTAADGPFSSVIILANPASVAASYALKPYLIDGTALDTVNGELQGEQTLFLTPLDLFGNASVSHFSAGQDDAIEITIAYQDKEGVNSQAHVRECGETAYRWRIHPGSLSDVVDGLALVNPSDNPIQVTARQVDAAGMLYHSVVLFEGALAGQAKGIYLFSTDFSPVEGAFYEIYSQQSIALTALRFATGSDRYFWQTGAVPLSELVSPDPRIGMVANLETHAHDVGGLITIEDEQTLRIDNFTYDGAGLDVRIYLALDSNFSEGISVGPDLRRSPGYFGETVTIALPGSVSLDDFNSVSVWCVPAGADFGSGVFMAAQ